MAAAASEDSTCARGLHPPGDNGAKLKSPGLYRSLTSVDNFRGKSPPGTSDEDAESFLTAPPGQEKDGDAAEVEKTLGRVERPPRKELLGLSD
eukprot:6485127-Amphidinium_carterae.1